MPDLTSLDQVPAWSLLAAGGGLVLVLALLVAAVRRMIRRRRAAGGGGAGDAPKTDEAAAGGGWLLDALTLVVAVIATATSAQGMWRFFGEAFHADGLLRVALFTMFEAALVVFALNARANIRRTSTGAGFDGIAVWIMAAVTGVLAATEADSWQAVLGRLLVPLVAAMLWERDLIRRMRDNAAAARKARPAGADSTEEEERVRWRWTPAYLAVRWGMATTEDRKLGAVSAQRVLAQLARSSWRVHRLAESKAAAWRQSWATRRLDRRLLTAAGHLDLAADAGTVEQFSAHLEWLRTLRASLTAGQLPAVAAAVAAPLVESPEVEAVRAELVTLRGQLTAATSDRDEIAAELANRDEAVARLEAQLAAYRAETQQAGDSQAADLERLRERLAAVAGERDRQARAAQVAAADRDRAAEKAAAALRQTSARLAALVQMVGQPGEAALRVLELADRLRGGEMLTTSDIVSAYGCSVATAGRYLAKAEELAGSSSVDSEPALSLVPGQR